MLILPLCFLLPFLSLPTCFPSLSGILPANAASPPIGSASGRMKDRSSLGRKGSSRTSSLRRSRRSERESEARLQRVRKRGLGRTLEGRESREAGVTGAREGSELPLFLPPQTEGMEEWERLSFKRCRRKRPPVRLRSALWTPPLFPTTVLSRPRCLQPPYTPKRRR
jgi:hypothetical protein